MKLPIIALPCILVLFQVNLATAAEDRAAKQQELDNACEMAREEKLVPLRKQLVEECMNKESSKNGLKQCESLYGNYDRTPGRAPLFYDLPECEAADKYKKSYRQSD